MSTPPLTPSTSGRIRILAADDHPMIRDGIALSVQAQPDMEFVGEASNGREALLQYRALRPDVTLLDLNMPVMGGVDTIVAIREEFPDARIVVLTTYNADVLAMRALKAGALGYLLKSSLRKDLMHAIRAAHQRKRYVPSEVALAIAEHVGSEDLSEREIDVVRGVASGLSNKEIAARLSLSEETVKGYLKSVMAKLNASDRSHAVAIAIARGILEL
ncbi:MAG: response regulator transcription factor [Pseudomonadota bacterium]